MKVHLSHQDYFALFFLKLCEGDATISLQGRKGRVFARCADRPVRLGLAQVVDLGADRFAFSLTSAGHQAVQTEEALAWLEREIDATRAAEPGSAEIVSLR